MSLAETHRGGFRTAPVAALLAVVAVAWLAAAGCSIRTMAIRETGAMMKDGVTAVSSEEDIELARIGMPGNLKTAEIMLTGDPENPDILYMLAQGYASYAFMMLEDEIDLADAAGDSARVSELKVRASALYARAQGYARRMFVPEVIAKFEAGSLDDVRAEVAKLKAEQAPALFWYTYSWAGRINLDQANPERIAELPRVEILIQRVVDLDPGYFHGLPLLTAGGVWAGRPPMFGGDLAKGRAFFEAGLKASDDKFLLGHFLLAKYYAVQSQDVALYCSELQTVLDAPADLLPEQQLMNNVTRRWAARWIGRAASLFPDAEGGCGGSAPAEEDVEEDDGMLQ
jgi:hypothetical protein